MSYRPEPGSIPTQPGVYRFRDAEGPGHLRRQGEEPAAAAVVVLPGHRQPAPAHRHDGDHRGQRRVDGGQDRGRGAPAGVLLDQGVRPAVQREVPRRQVLPVARGDRRRGVPAGDGRPRRQAQGHPLLRPLRPRLGDPRDRRPAAAGLPDALVQQRRLQALRARSAGPACSATSTSARRPASATSAPRSTARSSTTSATSWPARPRPFVRRIEKEMYAASDALDFEKAARLRDDLGALNKALEKQAVVLGDGTDADVIALAEDPLEVAVQIFYVRGGRIRGQRGWVADRVDEGGTAELVEDFLLQLYAGADRRRDPARDPGARRCRPTRRRTSSCSATCAGRKVAIRVPQRGDKKTLQETVAQQRRAVAGAAQDQAGQRPDHPQPGAGGDPGGARPRRGAAADRVLRRLQPPGHRGGRLDGGLRGRPGPQERVPPVRDPRRRRPERRRVDARGDHPPVPPAARRAGDQHRGDAGDESGPMLVDPETGRPRKFAYAPGLVVVDGGPPQVAAAQRALDELGIVDIPVCGLAKRLEEVWLPGQEDPVILAAVQRGPLPAPADPRRGAPLRDHPPPLAAVQVDGREPARRRARPRRGAPQDPAQALRLAEEAARGHGRGDRRGARHRRSAPPTAIKDAVAERAADRSDWDPIVSVNTATGEIEEG